MPFYPQTLFMVSFLNFFLAVFVFTKNVKAELNQAFAFFETCIAVWGFGMLIMTLAPTGEIAMTGITILQLGLFFSFSSFLNFVLALTNDQRKINKGLCFVAYTLSLVFTILDQLGFIISDVTIVFGTYQPVAGLLAPFFNLTFLTFMGYGVFLLYRRYKTTRSVLEKDRIKYLFLGMLLVVVSSPTNILLVQGFYVYPTAHLGLTIYACLTAYAIIRYRLMDITIIIKKALVYSTLTGLVTGLWLISVFIFGQLSEQFFLGSPIVAGMIIAFVVQPIRINLQEFIDKSFFRQGYNRTLVVEKFSQAITATADKELLLNSILKTISQIIPVEKISIMMANERGVYEISSSFHLEESEEKAMFAANAPLIRWLRHEKRDLLRREIYDNPNFKWLAAELLADMNRISASLIIPLFYRDQLLGLLNLGQKLSELDYSEDEINLLVALVNESSLALGNIKLFDSKVNNLINIIYALGMAIEIKDKYAEGHSQLVEKYTVEIGQRLGLSEGDIEALRIGSVLHDVGKIGISEEILEKKGKLSKEEFEAIKRHTLLGTKIVKPINLPEEALKIIRSHHERLDGSGYPDALKDEEISLPVRILSVVDVFVAMTSDRPYRKALSVEEAIEEIKAGSNRLFDPKVVDILIEIIQRNGVKTNAV